jgi:septal ring factor EnvC (AmiA/AmiB activator)
MNESMLGASQKKAQKKKSVLLKKNQQKGKKKKTVIAKGISQSENSLHAIRKDIEQAKKKVGELELEEKNALKGLARTKKQQLMVKEQVGKIMNEVRDLQDTLETIRQTENTIKGKLNLAKMSYARIAKKYQGLMQKHAPDIAISNDILTGTGNMGDMSRIARLPSYLRQMHTKLSLQLKEMQSLQGELNSQQEMISKHSSRQERLLKESEYEQQNIRNMIAEQKKKLANVRSSKEEMQRELEKKEQSAKQLAGLISTMVRNDKVKKEVKTESKVKEESKARITANETKKDHALMKKKIEKTEERYIAVQESKQARNDNTRVQSPSESFSGGFRWPSSGKRILRGFGQYRNSVTNTVLDNPGLDIACTSGSSALCAAPGTVSLVHWLPGYNSMVIVDHGNSYRTVYANLSSISVKKGQSIDAGSLIGRTTQSVDGEFLHFEIWKGKQRMNPLSYLR